MEKSVWVHQFDQQSEQTPSDYAATLLPRGITKIYAKAMDGVNWMADFYSHPLAPSSLDQFGSLGNQFADAGLALVPWVVPRTGSTAESTAHAALGRVMGGLVVDFEYHYDGFFSGNTAAATAYFQALQPIPWFAIAPDPRQPGRDYPASIESNATAILPQCYWTDFQRPALDVLNSALNTVGGFGQSIEPILPYDGSPEDIRAALDWCVSNGTQGVSLWRMGTANAEQLDAFGTTTPEPTHPTVPSLPNITLANNTDSLNNPRPPAVLKSEGFQAVRFVMHDDDRCRKYASDCKAAGLYVLGVEASESGGYMLPLDLVDAVQIGDEPDLTSPSSWTRTVDDYASDLRIYRGTWPGYTLIAAGMASGQPGYMQQLIATGALDGYSAIAVHPYAKTAAEASELLDEYQALTDLLIVVSEWNRPPNEISAFRQMLGSKVVQSYWFCDGDWMVPGFGLFDTSGKPTPAYDALFNDPSDLNARITALEAELAQCQSDRDIALSRISKALVDLQS